MMIDDTVYQVYLPGEAGTYESYKKKESSHFCNFKICSTVWYYIGKKMCDGNKPIKLKKCVKYNDLMFTIFFFTTIV